MKSEDRRYASEIEIAVNEYQSGHFEEARSHFMRAHQMFPSARTLRGLGKVEFELRNYGEATRLLQTALDSQERALDDGMQREVEKLIERARAYVGEVHVDILPETATVSVDGVVVARGPKAMLSLVIGSHILEFSAAGRLPERRTVIVRAGEAAQVQVVLPMPLMIGPDGTDANRGGSRGAPTDGPAPASRSLLSNRQTWIALSAVVLAAAGTALAFGMRGDGSGHVDPPQTSGNTPPGLIIDALERRP